VTESARPKVNFSDRLEMDVKHQGNISVFSRMQIREALQCNRYLGNPVHKNAQIYRHKCTRDNMIWTQQAAFLLLGENGNRPMEI
jgi:hypothetical protein